LLQEGLKYSPDLVIVSIFVDDLKRSTLSFRDYAKPKFERQGHKIALTSLTVPPPEAIERTLTPNPPWFYTLGLVRSFARRVAKERAPLGELEVDKLNAAILNTLRREVRQRGVKLLIVVIPDSSFAKNIDRSERFLEEWARETDVPVLALRQVFRSLAPAMQTKLYVGHWTPVGHQVAADAIRETIFNEQLLQLDRH
jgi:hypothetical protein